MNMDACTVMYCYACMQCMHACTVMYWYACKQYTMKYHAKR